MDRAARGTHARTLLDAADKAISVGDLDGAEALLARAGNEPAEALAVAARLRLHRGRRHEAAHLLRRIAAEAPGLGAAIEASGDRLLMLAWLEASASGARSREVLRECPLVGRFVPELDPRAEALVEGVLERHAEGPPPPLAGVAGPGPHDIPAGRRVALVFPRHVRGDPAFVECDFHRHYAGSARAEGLEVAAIDGDGFLYDRPGRDPTAALAVLEAELERFRPHHVLLEANFLPADTTLQPRHMAMLKRRLGFGLAAVMGDLHDRRPDFLGAWGDVADLVVAFHGLSAHLDRFRHPEKVMWLPSLQFDEALFDAAGVVKDFGLSLVGTNRRARLDYARALAWAGVDGVYRLHDRRRGEAPDTEEYAEILRRSKLAFNNGAEDDGTAMLTGRFTEAVLAGAVVLQEAGAPADLFYRPFAHYIPVANAHQAVAFAQFLLKREDWRARIAEAALDHYRRHYSSRMLWAAVLGRLAG